MGTATSPAGSMLDGSAAELLSRNDPSKAHPPGTIALSVADLARYHAFTMSIWALQYPPGTQLSMMQSLSVPHNLNRIIREMPPEAEWLHITADDQVMPPDSLLRLLDRMDDEGLDVLVPLIVRRRPPFQLLIFKDEVEEGFVAFDYDELPSEGILEVFSAGSGGMTIRRSVLERMREWQGHDRWFEHSSGEHVNEDTEFCRKLREMDPPVKIYADVEVHMGHCGMFIAWPYLNGDWGINIQMGEGPNGAMNAIFIRSGERDA